MPVNFTQNPAQTLPLFFLQSWPETEKAWQDIIAARDKMLALPIAVLPKLYGYIDDIAGIIALQNQHKILWPADSACLRFLDKDLVAQFLANPNDKVTRDALSLEVMMIHAALGLLKDAEPYTPEELMWLFSQEGDFYNDELFAFTLRRALTGEQRESVGAIIYDVLSAEAQGSGGEVHDWYGAMIYGLMLNVVWAWVVSEPSKLSLLMENYFYRSLVCGVPVREHLAELTILRAPDFMSRYLLENKEQVPTKFPADDYRPLADLIAGYYEAYGADPRNGFSQETYASKIYRGQQYADVYTAWLREAINIAVRIREGNWK